jgi:cell division protein FtsZ
MGPLRGLGSRDAQDKGQEETVPPELPPPVDPVPGPITTKIRAFGFEGKGLGAINRLLDERVAGVDLYGISTDVRQLESLSSNRRILVHIPKEGRPQWSGSFRNLIEGSKDETTETLVKALRGADLVFVALELGGRTGTRAASDVARLARELNRPGPLVVGIATLPFAFEGPNRMRTALQSFEQLRGSVDTLITISGDRLLKLIPRVPSRAASEIASQVLARAIRGITEIITRPGLVSLDFNDLRTIMKDGGVALIGIGESESENRAEDAVLEAINSPLLNVDIGGATGALINVTGGPDMTVSEAQKAAEVVQKAISPQARIIWGAAIDQSMGKAIRVLIIVTGLEP